MRMHREKQDPAPAPPVRLVERRRDFFTRAIISGLQDMTSDIERLPESEARTAALAAVARYAKTLAAAIEVRKRQAAEAAALAPVAPRADDGPAA